MTAELYSEKSFVVRGEFSKDEQDFLSKSFGKHNARLKGGPGWIFSNKRRVVIDDFLTKKSSLKSEKKDIQVPHARTTDISKLPCVRTTKDVESLVVKLMKIHKLEGWSVSFGHAKRVAGSCKYKTLTLNFSTEFAERVPQKSLENVILHEIAHALAGFKAKHGKEWKTIAKKIGCTGETCHTFVFSIAPFEKTCENNCFKVGAYKKVNVERLICKKCKGKVVIRAAKPI